MKESDNRIKLYRRSALTMALLVLLSLGGFGLYLGILFATGNFHEVEAGAVYRSAQLDGAGFSAAIEKYHIKTVLNLRGSNPESVWYVDELATMQRKGVVHYDVGISAQEPVPPAKADQIVAILRDAPKPILIHCQSGADRTGFAAALYRFAVQQKTAEDAGGELSLRYGHFPYLTSKTIAMEESFKAYTERPR